MRRIGLVGAALAAAGWAVAAAGAPSAQEAAPAEASPVELDIPDGPWRQLIRYRPQPGRESGISLWVAESAIVPEGAEPPSRTRTPREAYELWINHGAAWVPGQRYRIEHNRYNCGEGDRVNLAQAAFDLIERRSVAAPGDGERVPMIPHSAEYEVRRAVCDSGVVARQGATAPTITHALHADPQGPRPAEASQELQLDLDADGLPEILRAEMRPHSHRIDVQLIPGRDQTRPFNIIAVEQLPTGPLAQSKLRPVAPNTYLYACERQENRDREPCRPGIAHVRRGGVEVVTPGQPSLLIWLPDREPRIVRLPELLPPPPPPPLPISHHDRPPPLGVTHFGSLGGRCGGGTLPDGRFYIERSHGLMPGQRIGLAIASPDFAPLLHVFRRGEADRPLATLSAAADGRAVGQVFTAPDQADYVFRVTGRDPAAVGRWQVEIRYSHALDSGFPAEATGWDHIAAAHGCAAG